MPRAAAASGIPSASPAQAAAAFGIALERVKGGDYIICSTAPHSLAAHEPRLKKGTLVLKLNGKVCRELQREQVDAMLEGRGCSELCVTVRTGRLRGSATVALQKEDDVRPCSAAVYAVAAADELAAAFSGDHAKCHAMMDSAPQLLSRAAIAVKVKELAQLKHNRNPDAADHYGSEAADSRGGDVGDDCRGGGMEEASVVSASGSPAAGLCSSGCSRGVNSHSSSADSSNALPLNFFAVLNNLAALEQRVDRAAALPTSMKHQRPQLQRCAADARAVIAVALASASQTAMAVDSSGACSTAADACDSFGCSADCTLQQRLGPESSREAERASAAAAAGNQHAFALHPTNADEQEASTRCGKAEAVARHSALSLEARALVAGDTSSNVQLAGSFGFRYHQSAK
jgi:hypothetical protein